VTLAKSNLTIRIFTALIGVPLILVLLYLGPSWGFFVFLLVATAIGAMELYGMTYPGDRVAQAIATLLTLAVPMVLWFHTHDARMLLTLAVTLPIASMFLVLARLGDVHSAALRVCAGAFGPLYIGGGLATLALLRRDGPHGDGPGYVVLALALSWFSDTGAYFAGRFLGKHKLYAAVSPKKTVEGAVGGLVFGVLGATLGHYFYVRSLPLLDAVILALVATALGQAGDLGESLLKRSVGVKDSGGIVPGHGGILDRVDALLVTSTITYLYVLWNQA
jgi:phosphatidate cytidylyltransferase